MTALNDDEHFMRLAIRMGERGLGATAPNPSVGAVIVRRADGGPVEVIARGWTQPGGRPHAETEALARAGEHARGSTAYITLEPCSHHGQTPPCVDALIAAGVGRVVIGERDPDGRVSGRGVARLAAAGVAVREGVLGKQAHQLHLGHSLRVTRQRPFVQLKMALARDGSVPRGSGGRPLWATGPEARALGHLMRARCDAILVGAGTLAADDPELTCRLPGLENRSPTRIVLGRRLAGLVGSRLLAGARTVPLWVFAGEQTSSDVRVLAAAGVRVFSMPLYGLMFPIPDVLRQLAGEGVTRLLVEGGPATWSAFLATGFVDEALVFRAGGDERVAGDIAPDFERLTGFKSASPLELVESEPVGADRLWTYRRQDV